MGPSPSCSTRTIGSGPVVDSSTLPGPTDESVRQVAQALRRHGLATPATMLVDVLAPLSFIGDQLLVALGPFLPSYAWRRAASELAAILRDERSRELLQEMLNE